MSLRQRQTHGLCGVLCSVRVCVCVCVCVRERERERERGGQTKRRGKGAEFVREREGGRSEDRVFNLCYSNRFNILDT